jgi:hypothetical protein
VIGCSTMNGRLIRAISLMAIGFSLFVLNSCPTQKNGRGPISFSEHAVKIEDYSLFDVGIVDANDDGILDIYTSNHTALQSLLLGDGRGTFRDVYSEWGLSQQQEFPGLEDSWISPDFGEEGILIYRNRRQLIVRASRRNSATDISGRLNLDSPVEIVARSNWDCTLRQEALAHDFTRTQIELNLDSEYKDGLLVLKPELIAVPQTFSFDPSIPLSSIFVGAQKKHPPAHTFRLFLKDRHGLAWADWNGDGAMDLFISRGGVSGKIEYFPETYPYELFLKKNHQLVDVTSGANLRSAAVRARQVSWVDFDGDNLLDLFVYGIWSRHQLFKQSPGGRFLDITEESGLLHTDNGLSAWFDADEDGDADLFVAGAALELYSNENGHFHKTDLAENPQPRRSDQPEYLQLSRPSLCDFDGDGDIDIFLASAQQSAMLINDGGRFAVEDPASFGLPARAVTAAWVDIDNDSFPDLYVVPGGIFRRTDGLRFTRTGLLACPRGEDIVAARANWFDADNDGDRDVLISVLKREDEDTRRWSSKFFNNNGSPGHWLEIQVAGPPGNRNAIGARVVVELNNGRLLTQEVGISEGSHYSQGHYRLYFGLGREANPKSVKILWPDGSRESVENPGSDRILICGQGAPSRPV